jgi:hypothetical protein
MAKLQNRILQARAVLKQAASAQILTPQADDMPRVPKGQEGPEIVDPSKTSSAMLSFRESALKKPEIVDRPWPRVTGSAQDKVELKVEGVDVAGLISWIKAQILPEQKSLSFTAHIAADGDVTIAGDVSDLGIDGVPTLYLSPSKRSPIEALDDLALQLFQLRLRGDDARLRDLPLPEFRTLVDRLNEVADRRMVSRPDVERRQRYKSLSSYFGDVLDKHDDWPAIMILAAETARRGYDYIAAQKYFQVAIDHENRLTPRESDTTRRKL